jgi:glycosyltransferase A (GT-A) superfamily protein (DUF2064 family)
MKSAILIFAKVPISGLAKTRLSQNTCLTDSDCALIAEAMLKDTISLASQTTAKEIHIGYYPENGLNKIDVIVNDVRVKGYLNKNIKYLIQKGSNFDERFGSVVRDSLNTGVELLAGIGADLPFLDPNVINKALEILTSKIEENPIVIGPSSGGGIYLVGITKNFKPNWFSDHNLFRGGVELTQFASFCRKKNFPMITLPPYGDIDIEEDLISLMSYITALKNSERSIGFFFPFFTDKVIGELDLNITEELDQTRRRKIVKNIR